MPFTEIANENHFIFSKTTVFRSSYWILFCNCGLPTVFLVCEARGTPSHHNEFFAKCNSLHFIFLQNEGLPASYWICVTAGFQRSAYCVNPWKSVWHFLFLIIHFVDAQFCENLSVFPWHQNYFLCRDRETKSFYFSAKRRSSGLPIEFFCVTAVFQRSSYCVKTVEIRLTLFISYNIFCRYSVSLN